MTRLTDGAKTVEITMQTWTGAGYTPDFSADFFEIGGLPFDDETEAYIVEDAEYCVEQAEDWANARGDFANDDNNCADNNAVEVIWL